MTSSIGMTSSTTTLNWTTTKTTNWRIPYEDDKELLEEDEEALEELDEEAPPPPVADAPVPRAPGSVGDDPHAATILAATATPPCDRRSRNSRPRPMLRLFGHAPVPPEWCGPLRHQSNTGRRRL